MKTRHKILIIILSMFIGGNSFAQLTAPGGGASGHPGDSGIAGGGAPLGSGIALIIGLGMAYAGRKTFQLRKQEE